MPFLHPPLDICIRFNPASNIVPRLRTVNRGMSADINLQRAHDHGYRLTHARFSRSYERSWRSSHFLRLLYADRPPLYDILIFWPLNYFPACKRGHIPSGKTWGRGVHANRSRTPLRRPPWTRQRWSRKAVRDMGWNRTRGKGAKAKAMPEAARAIAASCAQMA